MAETHLKHQHHIGIRLKLHWFDSVVDLLYNILNKKHLKNVGPISHCEPPLHCHSLGVATVARQL